MKKTKKYILKPGMHQFAPGSPAVHTNDNLTDEEAEWYLGKFPHIASLFEDTNPARPVLAQGTLLIQDEFVPDVPVIDLEPPIQQ